MRALVFVCNIEEVAHAHAQKAPLEGFLSIPGLGIVSKMLFYSSKFLTNPYLGISI